MSEIVFPLNVELPTVGGGKAVLLERFCGYYYGRILQLDDFWRGFVWNSAGKDCIEPMDERCDLVDVQPT